MAQLDRIFIGFIALVLLSLSIHQIASKEALSPAVFIAVMVIGALGILIIYNRKKQ